jgi:Domain of unknown function (DUF4032)/Lipopolysaccharide kinase (Kdo/WaaP) family
LKLQLVPPRADAELFLDLPWNVPLTEWSDPRIVEVARGPSRHVVRFVNYRGVIYALKEMPERLGQREYGLLRRLRGEDLPVVEVVGLAAGLDGPDARAILITRHLDYSLPYRSLFRRDIVTDLRTRLLDALAQLLVRLHLAGFFWGDCSLSNTLFRRDAGGLAAYLVDAETGELHPELTPGQRGHDLAIAEENIAGELMDAEARYGLPEGLDAIDTAREVAARYEDLWAELTREEEFTLQERYRIDARLRRLNDLGFDVGELEMVASDHGFRLKVQPAVVEPGHHRRRLLHLTGLDVQENQARRLLNDLTGFRAHIEQAEGPVPEAVLAYRWMTQVFEPSIAAVPEPLRERLEPAELFHQILEHRWYLSEAAGSDVGMPEAVASYVARVLKDAPPERTVLSADTGQVPAVSAERPDEP